MAAGEITITTAMIEAGTQAYLEGVRTETPIHVLVQEVYVDMLTASLSKESLQQHFEGEDGVEAAMAQITETKRDKGKKGVEMRVYVEEDCLVFRIADNRDWLSAFIYETRLSLLALGDAIRKAERGRAHG